MRNDIEGQFKFKESKKKFRQRLLRKKKGKETPKFKAFLFSV